MYVMGSRSLAVDPAHRRRRHLLRACGVADLQHSAHRAHRVLDVGSGGGDAAEHLVRVRVRIRVRVRVRVRGLG